MCDVERIAFYINDDLSDAERLAVDAHLADCEACRTVVADLRHDAVAVTAWYGAAIPALRRAMAPSRRWWLPAAVAVVVLMLTFGAARVDAVGARLVKLFPFLHVRVMPAEEADRYANERKAPPLNTEHITPPPQYSVAEAEQQVGFHVARPAYVPPGFAVGNVSVSKGEIWAVVSQSFEKPGLLLALSQEHTKGRGRREIPVPEGGAQEVKVNGEPAMLVNGVWKVEADGSKVWDSESARYLWFQWEGQTMSISVHRLADGAPLLSGKELIKMAESLK